MKAKPSRSLASFFVLAFFLSWLIEIPLALKAQGLLRVPLPFSLHYLAGYGPMLAAILLTWKHGGPRGLRDLFQRMFRWCVSPIWWLVAFSPVLFYLLVAASLWFVQGQTLDVRLLGQVEFLPDLGLIALPFWVVTFGIGEETGWRGYALPRLQEEHGALSATVTVWFFWGLWHLPLFFYTYDLAILPMFLLGLFAGAVVFTWLYNSTGGSILIVAVWHGLFNFTTACTACAAGTGAAGVSMVVMIWAGSLLLLYVRGEYSDEDAE